MADHLDRTYTLGLGCSWKSVKLLAAWGPVLFLYYSGATRILFGSLGKQGPRGGLGDS